MSSDAACPQCRFLTRQLGRVTACLLHITLASEAENVQPGDLALDAAEQPGPTDYDEPYTVGQLRLNVDRTGPFTLREYVRLQLLRTRVQAQPSRLDEPAPRPRPRSLARR